MAFVQKIAGSFLLYFLDIRNREPQVERNSPTSVGHTGEV